MTLTKAMFLSGAMTETKNDQETDPTANTEDGVLTPTMTDFITEDPAIELVFKISAYAEEDTMDPMLSPPMTGEKASLTTHRKTDSTVSETVTRSNLMTDLMAPPMTDKMSNLLTLSLTGIESNLLAPLMTSMKGNLMTKRITDRKTNTTDTSMMTPKESNLLTDLMTLIDPTTDTLTDTNGNMMADTLRSNTVSDNMTNTILTDSLTELMAHTLTDVTVDCYLCMYSPLKCKGSCSYANWTSNDTHWIQMRNKELRYIHDKCYMLQDPAGLPDMRSRVLDWMFEVSSFYFFQRQTSYLAQDFLDRHLMAQERIDTSSLQLIAITALFIAAKKEEICPPKVNAFAYITAGACEVWEIHHMEVKMLKALKWRLCPETPIAWLNIYAETETQQCEEKSLEPFFTQESYIQITELLDLCILDIDSLDYSYSALAAAAICHYTSYEVVHRISGMSWKSVAPCYWWMNPFKDLLQYNSKPELRNFPKVRPENRHNIQTHQVNYNLLRGAQKASTLSCCLSMTPFGTSGILTPTSRETEKLLASIQMDLLDSLSDDE